MSIRKFSEDPVLRQFLSSHFDAQNYIQGVLKEGRSEECYKDINTSIDEVNLEIKNFIGDNKDELMSGMQDVALLSERYRSLAVSSEKLHRGIERLKQEALESHDMVKLRTTELERIHSTSIMLRHLRQFAHAKSQLDHHLKVSMEEASKASGDGDSKAGKGSLDIRFLATAAKTLYELECLLETPSLMTVEYVVKYVPGIRQFGEQIREKAQERLLSALKERNQATVAASLQIFFNLKSLPQIVLLAIDTTVKHTVDLSKGILDLDALVMTYPEIAMGSAPATQGKKGTGSASHGKVAVRELCHTWTTKVYEQAMQVHVLQKVIAKKVDPTTHTRFAEVLRAASANNTDRHALGVGKLLDLFWSRVGMHLQDMANDMLKKHPIAATIVYPQLRKAASEVVKNLQDLSRQEMDREVQSSLGSTSGFANLSDTSLSALNDSNRVSNRVNGVGGMGKGGPEVLFGSVSATWGPDTLFGLLGSGSRRATAMKAGTPGRTVGISSAGKGAAGGFGGGDGGVEGDLEGGLLSGLRPIRDRYLLGALSKMNAPILQMFPDLDGYTAAVPSKRDLQALLKALVGEMSQAMLDGDTELGLLHLVCRESMKSVHLMLSKIEGMASTGPESKKLNPGNGFAKNGLQEHNAQLITLVHNFRDGLEKLPGTLVKMAQDSSAFSQSGMSSLSSAASDLRPAEGESAILDRVKKEVETAVSKSTMMIDELLSRQLLAPIVEIISTYAQSCLLGMLKEGVSVSSTISASESGTTSESIDGSNAVIMLTQNLPDIFRIYLQSLPRSVAVQNAIQETLLRTLSMFTTVASLQRPINEVARLRIAKDMTALEASLLSIATIDNAQNCPVTREFKAFRRLLFMEDAGSSDAKQTRNPKATAAATSSASSAAFVPSKASVLQLPYSTQLRPSTLLNYLSSCAPPQMPSPYETEVEGQRETLQSYVDALTALAPDAESVESLYTKPGKPWRSLSGETRCWQCVQSALDVFVQRLSVLDAKQRLAMRAWYEGLLDIGGYYYGNC